MCFAVNIAHSKSIRDDFLAAGVRAEHLDAYTDPSARREIIAGFKAGEIKLLTSVNVLGTGFNVPDAACLILARPTLSEACTFSSAVGVSAPPRAKPIASSSTIRATV